MPLKSLPSHWIRPFSQSTVIESCVSLGSSFPLKARGQRETVYLSFRFLETVLNVWENVCFLWFDCTFGIIWHFLCVICHDWNILPYIRIKEDTKLWQRCQVKHNIFTAVKLTARFTLRWRANQRQVMMYSDTSWGGYRNFGTGVPDTDRRGRFLCRGRGHALPENS